MRRALLLSIAGWCVTTPNRAQDLGDQRAATSMLTFLKIGVGARAVALGEAFVPVADDATTMVWNPSGLAELPGPRIHISHTEWPADVDYENVMYTSPFALLDGAIGIHVASLRTTLDYTSEVEPLPSGRTFSYSDLLVGGAYARQFTDRFSFGVAVKYVREDLGSEVGGSVLNSWSLDLGTIFRLPYRGFRMSMAWTNFGPDFKPPGGFTSVAPDGSTRNVGYASFSPASVFAFGVAMNPIVHGHYNLMTTLQFDHPADTGELIKGGAELWFDDMVALRAGWNPRADAMQVSAGFGLAGTLGGRKLHLDYAYTDGDALGRVDRLSLEVEF